MNLESVCLHSLKDKLDACKLCVGWVPCTNEDFAQCLMFLWLLRSLKDRVLSYLKKAQYSWSDSRWYTLYLQWIGEESLQNCRFRLGRFVFRVLRRRAHACLAMSTSWIASANNDSTGDREILRKTSDSVVVRIERVPALPFVGWHDCCTVIVLHCKSFWVTSTIIGLYLCCK